MTDAMSGAYRTMRELADDDRPRERLLKHGPAALSNAELIAIILRSGMPGQNVVDMARDLLALEGGLPGLASATGSTLQRVNGLGPAKAAQVIAAIELGRRVQLVEVEDRPMVGTPESVYALLGPRLLGEPREQLYVLAVDPRGRLLGSVHAVNGGVSAVSARPAEVFREAIVLNATAVVLAHNHPSGDPQPSPNDVAVTNMLAASGKLLDIEVLDHVILGANSFVSLKREGHISVKQAKGNER